MYTMRRPLHPGEVIKRRLAQRKKGTNIARLAEILGVSRSTLSRVVNHRAPVKADLAIRLAKALGLSPEAWMNLQVAYDLWEAAEAQEQRLDDAPCRYAAPEFPLMILIMAAPGDAGRGGRGRGGRIHR